MIRLNYHSKLPSLASAIRIVVPAMILFLMTATAGYAHRIMIHAWIEDGTVITQSRFSGGRKVTNGPVGVYDDSGKQVLTGTTDEEGVFSFGLDFLEKPSALKVVINAGPGHQAYWQLPEAAVAKAVEGVSAPAPGPAPIEEAVTAEDDAATAPPPAVNAAAPGGCLDEAAVQDIVEKAMDRKLSPVMDMLVSIEESMSVGVEDIMAGVGYILGLAGLGALIYARVGK